MKELLISCLLLLSGYNGLAQSSAAKPAPQYMDVEKLPQLPGGGGTQAVVQAVQERLVYPATAEHDQVQGRAKVKFQVNADGTVSRISIIEPLRADCDSAVVAAVRQLPRFEPGIAAGKPIAISFTLPITFKLAAPGRRRLGLSSGK